MNEMATEWGPARNNPDSPYHRDAVQVALETRTGGQVPDDN